MTIKHHPQKATLLAYATGNLPEAFNLIIASHVSLCDDCRAVVESCDAVGGSLLEETQEVAMCAESFERTMATLNTPQADQTKYIPGVLPAPLQAYVGGDIDAVKWRPIGLGVRQAILPTSTDASARLLHIPAGVAIPDHSHEGNELTLVLQGAFADEGDHFARGDLEVADGDVTHTPVAAPGADCICLAVTDAPLSFKGWLPRVVQRFVGI